MTFLIFFIIFIWGVQELKKILLWLYLWQLKEYHWRRFKAHFSTYKGKLLLFNKLIFLKIILLLFIVFFPLALKFKLLCYQKSFTFLASIFSIVFLTIIYLGEDFVFIARIKRKKIAKPVFTLKIVIIFLLSVLIVFFPLIFFSYQKNNIISLINLVTLLLLIDLLTPLLVTFSVTILEPLAICWRKKLMRKARERINKFKNLTVIGITGSYGKTSTKEFLAHILSKKFNVLKTREHQNSEVGISKCILNDLKPEHEIFVCEMGAYQKGGIKMLSDIVKPKIGILTGINEQHLATFGSQENIIETKYELIKSLPEDGTAIFNGENKYCRELYERTKIKKMIVSLDKGRGDVWAENIRVEKKKISFEIVFKDGEKETLKTNLLGKHNIQNLLMASLVAKELGISLREIKEAVAEIKPLKGSLRLLKIDEMNILDATYSANPNSVIAHLDYLRLWKGRKLIVMPCLIELGKSSEKIHRKLAKMIGEVCDLAIITTRECFACMKEEVEEKVIFLEDTKKIMKKMKEFSGDDNIILLESRVPLGIRKLLEK